MEIEIPGDVRGIHVFLLHKTGECIADLSLGRLYMAYGKAKQTVSAQLQVVADLEDGENDTVEYKPFTKPMSAKENELVETMIAFANTAGGRIYVGVLDNGSPQGEAAARTAFRCELDQALDAQIERLETLKRDRIKPVPVLAVKKMTVHDQPIVVAEVEHGPLRPYATHENKVFMRKGSTNKLADPHTEWPILLGGGVVA